jgi:acetyl-CoA carboxylase biotin carboxyl carrier protein
MAEIQVRSDISGLVYKILVKPGDKVEEEDSLLILESMKMEIHVTAPEAGTVKSVLVKESEAVSEGTPVVVLESAS